LALTVLSIELKVPRATSSPSKLLWEQSSTQHKKLLRWRKENTAFIRFSTIKTSWNA